MQENQKEGKKPKVAAKKVLKPQILSGNDLSAEAGMEKNEPTTQGENGESQTDDILSKYRFLTGTKPANPLKLKKNTSSVQRKGVPKLKAKDSNKKVKASLKNIDVAHPEKVEESVEENSYEAVSSGSQVMLVEAEREQMESTAASPVNNMKEESDTTVDEEENAVNIANILDRYKYMMNVAPEPREDEKVEEMTLEEPTAEEPTVEEMTAEETTAEEMTVEEPTVEEVTMEEKTMEKMTMEETTEEDLIGKAEAKRNGGSDLVETKVKEEKGQSAKTSKKSSAAEMRKDHVKERVPCKHCEKTFATSSSLKQHITLHTNEKPYQCKECPDKFRNSNQLLLHKKKQHLKSLPEKMATLPSTSM